MLVWHFISEMIDFNVIKSNYFFIFDFLRQRLIILLIYAWKKIIILSIYRMRTQDLLFIVTRLQNYIMLRSYRESLLISLMFQKWKTVNFKIFYLIVHRPPQILKRIKYFFFVSWIFCWQTIINKSIYFA